VLVLDEPTFGQDARTWRELVALLAEQRDAGRAIVIVTHDRPLIRALDADELAVSAPRIVPNRPYAPPIAAISHDSPHPRPDAGVAP
jgi:energy-coupling factor transport system ATP-binding protein